MIDPPGPHQFHPPAPLPLGPAEGELLVRVALRAIRARWSDETPALEIPLSGPLTESAGAFVTVSRGEDLRGCLGYVGPTGESLWKTVEELALSASSSDPRFEAVTENEWPELEVEVSVLGRLEPLPLAGGPEAGARLVRVGEHGLLIRHRGRSGLLLPQVASEHGWDSLRFLDATCHKAGLPAGAWREPGASVSAFRCALFHGSSALLGPLPGRQA